MRITFHGAAGEVTGSRHLLEFNGWTVLLDCGMFQGPRAESRRKNEKFGFRPSDVDAVILSHAHIDHSGMLPRLYRQGFRGVLYCTPATADMAAIMLKDSAKIQIEDAKYLKRKLRNGHPAVDPLYEFDDVSGLMKLIEEVDYHEWFEITADFRFRFLNSGHILGAAIVEIDVEEDGAWKRVTFSGDLGRRNLPLLRDPETIERCDVLICESTYGNRVHPPIADLKEELLSVFRKAYERKGKVIIPAFSLGRTQQLVYYLNELYNEGRLPRMPVVVDSPLATRLTDVYRKHADQMDAEVQATLKADEDPFDFPLLHYTQSQQESIALNRAEGPFAVISASGMCENGRVVHHLKHSVSDEKNIILIMGFQARHTLGRRLVDRLPEVRIFDRRIPLKAEVIRLEGLSAHADVEEFRWWFEELSAAGGVGQLFLVHGEEEAATALASIVTDDCDEPPIIPHPGEQFEI